MKNSSAIFTFFLLLGFSGIYPQAGNNGGFLALSGALEWEYYQAQTAPNDLFLAPLTFSGVSSNFEIVSHLQIAPEVLHLAEYYGNQTANLSPGEVIPFSFANYELTYRVGNWKIVALNMGFKTGHYGYLSDDWSTPAYTLFIAPVAAAYIPLGNSFMLTIPVEIPVGLYLNNLDEFFSLKAGAEVAFDPKGDVKNPETNNTLFSIGFSWTYLKIKTSDAIDREINFLKPYLKFTFLY